MSDINWSDPDQREKAISEKWAIAEDKIHELNAEIDRLRKENEDLLLGWKELNKEYDELWSRYYALQQELESNNDRH